MRTRWILGLPLGLLLAGCGSGSKGSQNDLASSTIPEVVEPLPSADAATSDTDLSEGDTPSQSSPDGGGCSTAPLPPPVACPYDAGVNNAIINPCGAAQGGGTRVARQNPPLYSTCQQ
jgi:hypothetical protein